MHKAASLFLTGAQTLSGIPFYLVGAICSYKFLKPSDQKKIVTSEFSPEETKFVRNVMKEYGIGRPDNFSLISADTFKSDSIERTLYVPKYSLAEVSKFFKNKELINQLRSTIGHECGHLINDDSRKIAGVTALAAIASQSLWHSSINRGCKVLTNTIPGKIALAIVHIGAFFPKTYTTHIFTNIHSRIREFNADEYQGQNSPSKEELLSQIKYFQARHNNFITSINNNGKYSKLPVINLAQHYHKFSNQKEPFTQWLEKNNFLLNLIEITNSLDPHPLDIKRMQHYKDILEQRFGSEKNKK
jgi:hypothetical protein